MLPLKYAYLFASSLFLIPWLILYITRKDLRLEMKIVSLIIGIAGVLAEGFFYTQDWVKPITITGTKVGLEDFILGFASGGSASVIYKVLFRKINYRIISFKISHWKLSLPLIFIITLTSLLFYQFKIFSFWANCISLFVGLIFMLILRKDLIKEMLCGGFLIMIISLPIYWLTYFLFPLWQQTYWHHNQLSGFYFLYIPIEDIIWWLLAGAFAAIIYDYWFSYSLRKTY